MKTFCWILVCLMPFSVIAGDSATSNVRQPHSLKGYKKILYNLVLLHPKMNSRLEKELLKHYLIGSGETYLLHDSDFIRLKKTVPAYSESDNCNSTSNQHYCSKHIDLSEEPYFGWALGNINGVYSTSNDELISIADVYDFNKAKKGARSKTHERLTRLFRLLSPASVKAFVVTYGADAYVINQ